MHAQGTGVVEIKSGYGLDLESETRLLRLAREVTDEVTFLGGHVVPPEYRSRRADYVDLVTGPMLTRAGAYARWVDVFCEPHSPYAFTEDEARAILVAGRSAGLGLRVHGNQLGPGPGVRLAVELGAASVDHCTYLTSADVDALAGGTTGCDPAARRRVLDAAPLPRRACPARRRRPDRAGDRLQPGYLLHLVDAVRHRAGRPGAASHPAGGLVGGDPWCGRLVGT